jgi:hypothetical protein
MLDVKIMSLVVAISHVILIVAVARNKRVVIVPMMSTAQQVLFVITGYVSLQNQKTLTLKNISKLIVGYIGMKLKIRSLQSEPKTFLLIRRNVFFLIN